MMTFYFIPTEEQYLANRFDKNKTWEDVYGKRPCTVCGKRFIPGDSYTSDHHGGFRHVACGGVV
jgi:hypothetical protein